MNVKRNNADVNRHIAEIREEIRSKSEKLLSKEMTELLEIFAKSSEELHEELKIMRKKIDKL